MSTLWTNVDASSRHAPLSNAERDRLTGLLDRFHFDVTTGLLDCTAISEDELEELSRLASRFDSAMLGGN